MPNRFKEPKDTYFVRKTIKFLKFTAVFVTIAVFFCCGCLVKMGFLKF